MIFPRPLNIKYLKIKTALFDYMSEVQNFEGMYFAQSKIKRCLNLWDIVQRMLKVINQVCVCDRNNTYFC